MTDLSKKSIMVVAPGIFCEFAAVLARDFGKVWYCPWSITDEAQMEKQLIGTGIAGLEVVRNPYAVPFDRIDCWAFTDVLHADMQEDLKKRGAAVFGPGRGDKLELQRAWAQRYMRENGLPTNPFDEVTGLDNLREYLKKHPDVFVKMEDWRGDWESMHAENYAAVENELNMRALKLGPFGRIAKFICEKPLKDKAELGLDTFCVDGMYPGTTFAGIEIKNCGFVGMWRKWDDWPEELRRPFDVIAPLLKQWQYRCFLSSETRIGKDKKPYTIDWTTRQASPPGEIYIEMDEALPQRVWAAAHGQMMEPKPIARYGACAAIKAPATEEIPQNNFYLNFPAKYRRNLKIRSPVRIDGNFYSLEKSILGQVVGWGETQKAAIEMVKTVAGEVTGDIGQINLEALDKAGDEIEKSAEEYGIRMFPGTDKTDETE